MRLLPPSTAFSRAVTISVDLPDTTASSTVRADDIADRLLPIFQSYGVQVTWGVHSAAGDLAARVTSIEPRHQIAMLMDPRWIGEPKQRSTARRQIEAAVADMQRCGQSSSILVIRRACQILHRDLLVKNGVLLVVSDRIISGPRGAISTLRHGLWEIPAVMSLPTGGTSTDRRGLRVCGGAVERRDSPRESRRGNGRRLRRVVDSAVAGDQLAHLAIDGPAAATSAQATRGLERLLRHIDRRRSQGQLQVVPIAEIAEQLPHHRSTPMARSVLHALPGDSRAA